MKERSRDGEATEQNLGQQRPYRERISERRPYDVRDWADDDCCEESGEQREQDRVQVAEGERHRGFNHTRRVIKTA